MPVSLPYGQKLFVVPLSRFSDVEDGYLLFGPEEEIVVISMFFFSGCKPEPDAFWVDGFSCFDSFGSELQSSFRISGEESVELIGVGMVDDLAVKELRFFDSYSSIYVGRLSVVCDSEFHGPYVPFRCAPPVIKNNSDSHNALCLPRNWEIGKHLGKQREKKNFNLRLGRILIRE